MHRDFPLMAHARLEATSRQRANLGEVRSPWFVEGIRVCVPFLPHANLSNTIAASKPQLEKMACGETL